MDNKKNSEKSSKITKGKRQVDAIVRRPLAVDNTYIFLGSTNCFKILALSFPETANDYFLRPWVTIEFSNRSNRPYWYVFENEKSFWQDNRFKNAIDA